MAGYYNKDKDYSKELMRTDLSSSERAQLTQERQNKIDAVYGGKEPTLADGSGKTYNQKYGGSSSGGSSGGGSRTMPNGFQGSANGVGVWDADQDAIRDIMNSNSKAWWSADDTERERLHAANEALARLLNGDNGTVGFDPGAGYWSGDAGQKQQLLQFAFGGVPSYTSRYDEKLNELVDQILNRDPFSYDAENDPLYQFYQDRYQRNGDKAMRDTLGAQAARTGGLSSSYAGSVAQQSYNDYMQGLNDIVPELYKLAYSMYKDDEDSQRLLRLFNTDEGKKYMKDELGMSDEQVEKMSWLGISGIANVLCCIKMAKYYELTENDVVGTVLTDSAVMYKSRVDELNEMHGAYNAHEAALDHNLHMLGLKTDSMMEMGYAERKRVHNLKYYTWVEQQQMKVEDLNAQWYDTKNTWDAVHAQAKELDELINEFNEATGLLKTL